jgi:uncharacterized protein (TIGR02246 family)
MIDDDTQIRNLFTDMLAAWTAGDAHGYGRCFTEDADYVSYDGTHARGRQPMVDAHERLFRGVLHGSALVGDVESIRYLGHDVAVVHATGSVLMPWRRSLPRRRLSRQTLVVMRGDEGWRITALHNGRIRPVSIPRPDSLPARASRTMSRMARVLGVGRTTAVTPGGASRPRPDRHRSTPVSSPACEDIVTGSVL